MSDLGNKEIFAKNLKYYMEQNNKDRNDICNILDIPYTTFTDWYNATTYPRIDKIEMIANYFGIKKSDLIENKNNNEYNEINTLFSKYKNLSEEDKKFVTTYIEERIKQMKNNDE